MPSSEPPPPGAAPRLRRANHAGFTVASLDDALAFWIDVLGCTAEPPRAYGGAYLAGVTGVPGADARTAVVHAPGLDVELLEFREPAERGQTSGRPCDVGFVHLCFEVADVEAVTTAARPAGWAPQGAPQTVDGGPLAGARIVYLRNGEGLTLELLQLPAAAAA